MSDDCGIRSNFNAASCSVLSTDLDSIPSRTLGEMTTETATRSDAAFADGMKALFIWIIAQTQASWRDPAST